MKVDTYLDLATLSAGQMQFIDMARKLAGDVRHHCTYVMASPLNLLSELFTVKGAGTMLRRGAQITVQKNYKGLGKAKLRTSIETHLRSNWLRGIFEQSVSQVFVEQITGAVRS